MRRSRRYGWSAKVPISVVTDFEEFAIYSCTKKPNPGDKPSDSRIKYLTFEQYLEEFDFLWDIFAKENLPKGRFDKYVQSDTGKKGTATLGKTIRLTAGHQAKVEEKPEVRKAGGVYYTPKYIVDYIVENTVGKLVEGKAPKDVEKLRICDPACGSGSFLIGAYQYLLDWHLRYYTEQPPPPRVGRGPGGGVLNPFENLINLTMRAAPIFFCRFILSFPQKWESANLNIQFQRSIDYAGRRIDELVYECMDLTESEIKIN